MSAGSHPTASPAEQEPSSPPTACGDSIEALELKAYVRELPRLLAEGHAGRYALIRDDTIISVWDTQRDVLQAGYERYGLEPFSVKKIDPRDPQRLAALQARGVAACPASAVPSAQTERSSMSNSA